MDIASSTARSDEPDSSLIIAAARAFADMHGLDEPTRIGWSVTERMHRPRSTVLKVRLEGLAGEIPYLYHKQFCFDATWPRSRTEQWALRIADSLERSLELSKRFSDLATGTDIGIAPILAVDLSRLVTVTGAVAGEPLGKPYRHILTASSRQRAHRRYRQVGQAIGLLERSAEGEEVPDTYLSRRYFDDTGANLSDALTVGELKSLRVLLEGLHEEFLESDGQLRYYSHGDINRNNVLVVPRGINLIDFSWRPRPRTYDLVLFLLRLELSSPSVRPWTTALTESVLEGYGRHDVEKSPEFKLLRLGRLARRFRKLASSTQHWMKARRVLAEIRRSFISHELESPAK